MGARGDEITVSVRLVEAMARWVVADHDIVMALMARAGVPDETLADPRGRVGLDTEARLWTLLTQHTGDAAIGLRCAARVDIDAYGAWGFTVASSETVRDAIETSNAFFKLLHDVAEWQLEEKGTTATLSYTYRGTSRQPHPQAVALALGGTVQLMRRMAWADWTPLEVHIAHGAPNEAAPYLAHFRAPVNFDAPRNALVLEVDHLDKRLTTAETGLHTVLRRHAQQCLAELEELPERVVLQVRTAVLEQLSSGKPTMQSVAHALALSQRTLQRRLSEADATFVDVLESTRREMALSLLEREALAIDEVAAALGYSEASAFRRAFKRWTGEPPSAYRKRLRTSGSET